MITTIQHKVMEYLRKATIDDVDTDVVVGIEDTLIDWEQYKDYPRIVVVEENVETQRAQIGGNVIKEYTVAIFLLCFGTKTAEIVRQRDVILERIEECLRINQRLDNLADNKEKVYSSYIPRIRMSRSGVKGSYLSVVWIDLRVNTERKVVKIR